MPFREVSHTFHENMEKTVLFTISILNCPKQPVFFPISTTVSSVKLRLCKQGFPVLKIDKRFGDADPCSEKKFTAAHNMPLIMKMHF